MKKIVFSISKIPPGFIITILLTILFFVPIRLIDFIELQLLDSRFLAAQQSPQNSEIILIAIDNRSEDRLGRWPWDRNLIAQLINIVSKGQPAAIGIDIVFAEKQLSPLDKILSIPGAKEKLSRIELSEIKNACDYDGHLAKSISKAKNVILGYYFLTEQEEDAMPDEIVENDPKYRIIVDQFQGITVRKTQEYEKCFPPIKCGHGVETSTERISVSALTQGFLNIFPDTDGVVRKSYLVMKQGSDLLASFPLQILNAYYKMPGITVETVGKSDECIKNLKVGDFEIPVDLDSSLLIDYTRKLDSFPEYSFVDVLDGKVDVKNFQGKIVIVGISDPGLMRDNWVTPVSDVTPGFKIHALTVATCIERRFVQKSGYFDALSAFFIFFFGTLITFLVPLFKKPLYSGILATFLFVSYLTVTHLVFKTKLIVLNMTYPLSCIVIVYTAETLRYTGASLKRAIKKIFEKEIALKMLGETQKELSRLVRISDVFCPSSTTIVFDSDRMMEETPVLTWKLILTSLGISSGALILFNNDGSFQIIASTGNLWEKTNLDLIRKRMENDPTPLIINRTSDRQWFSSNEIKNLMAFPVVSEKTFILVALFLNKSVTEFSETDKFTTDDVKLAQTSALQAIIAIQNSKLNVALKQAQLETIFRLAMSIECRDRETGLHVHRVSEYAGVVAEGIQLPEPEVKLIKSSMPLHDIGKIAIPDNILLKPGRLTDQEFEIIKKHPVIGAKVLEGSSSSILQAARIIALYHQERYNGSGYPYGLKEKNIPLYGRIAAVADIFDALASKRSYKEAIDFDKTFEILMSEAGKALDPDLVKVFIDRKEIVLKIYHHYRETPDSSLFDYPAKD